MESFILFCVGASRGARYEEVWDGGERVKASDDNLPAHLVTTSTCRYFEMDRNGQENI